jgi:hypothetical protein
MPFFPTDLFPHFSTIQIIYILMFEINLPT